MMVWLVLKLIDVRASSFPHDKEHQSLMGFSKPFENLYTSPFVVTVIVTESPKPKTLNRIHRSFGISGCLLQLVFCWSSTPDCYANVGAIVSQAPGTQRAQYPLIKEYGLNYIGLHIMI